MKFLLFIEKSGPYDHDLQVSDFVKAFNIFEDSMAHYEEMHNKWPYTDDCQLEGCEITEIKFRPSPDVWIGDEAIQVIHQHGETRHKKISRPRAAIAKWTNDDFTIVARRGSQKWIFPGDYGFSGILGQES